ncbi:MAG: UDP-N-acetylglucosamine--N-acetylmuramyl-(pentapeptide) pyrophosphoryl-undecaprenol N-acetylglucosamine transferase [Candidatus Doudnabacteria bacterium]|nr:UDP-N-acetylglucosamine--N-acetylmuramyl-(pentapeptide) pyrophosphoryl-undecaprenol N-acetylglucosamine transferase [bacterium]MDZ4244214.1 UDP-N-acetylglucosamine--N-acetylmuramyl-(pentapeptide) pyrophosphoryl-undecaprenol N-acetylglucosamine transferase [Candidatus Doudnabacteria bacterium]
MRIFLVGGGTGGPTAPLLAVAEALHKLRPQAKLFFVGTAKGLEKKFIEVESLPMEYLRIPAGKWRRYFSLLNIIDIFKTLFGLFKSLWLICKYHPDIIFGAGSFVQVPVVWAGYLCRVPVVVHQQDVIPLLSTRLTSPFARAVTVSFDFTSKEFSNFSGLFKKVKKTKIVWTGNPVRHTILGGAADKARKTFALNSDYPAVLVLGGAAGSARLNEVVIEALPELAKYVQIIHSTGGRIPKGKKPDYPHYHPYNFLGQELRGAYAVADLVLCRGGMSTIAELSRLGKVAIIVPLPDSPQEENARLLAHFKSAVVVFEEFFTPELFVKLVRKILWSKEMQEVLKDNIRKIMPVDADKQIAKLLIKICDKDQK